MSDSLFCRLRELAESDFYPFHMPGHKRIFPGDDEASRYRADISEISGFDNLHYPEGILLNAQKKAAALYGADESFYLVGGATAGILSAVCALDLGSGASGTKKQLLISRGSHMSVYHAAYLAGIRLKYIYPQIDDETYLAQGISAAAVIKKLEEDADIGAVLINSPTYEGICSDMAEIAGAVHHFGKILIVDEAHGAHFGFHPAFPESAVRSGADIVIHGLHKTLPAPTQTGLLHICSARVDKRMIRRYLRIFQSSSPSYPLMAGIERCLDHVTAVGAAGFEEMLRLRKDFVLRTGQLNNFRVLSADEQTQAAAAPDSCNAKICHDPCKIVILIRCPGLTGKQLCEILHEKYHIEMEMSGAKYALAIVGMMDKAEGFDRLAAALAELDEADYPAVPTPMPRYGGQPEIVYEMARAWNAETVPMAPEAAIGRVAAEFIIPYPPGIPLLVPGERIDKHIADTIQAHMACGRNILGLTADKKINIIRL